MKVWMMMLRNRFLASAAKLGLLSLLSAAGLAGTSAQAGTTIFSEDFSTAIAGNYGAPNPIPGSQFTVFTGNVDLLSMSQGNFGCSDNPSGACVDLVGAFANGGITSPSNLTLSKNDTYTVTFGADLQGFSTTDTAQTMFDVSLGDQTQHETLTAAEGNTQFSLTFNPTASQSDAAITFLSISGADSVHGAVIDNIVVSAEPTGVPEPASWAMMLVGFGAIGGTMRLRRRGVAVA